MGLLEKAKQYQKIKNWLHLAGLCVTIAILSGAIFFGLTQRFYDWAFRLAQNPYAVLSLYFLFFSLYSLTIQFPFQVYSGYHLERRFDLSNQTFRSWLWEWTKASLLSFGITLILVLILYLLIWNTRAWWFWTWLGYAAFSLVLNKLFPVLIIPLFYKYSPIADIELKRKIEDLAHCFGVSIENVYALNLSKTTKKANAAFAGFGKTKRVILGDTLLDSFNHSEIENVLAHELGHYKHHDIWKQFGFGLLMSLMAFWIVYHGFGIWSEYFGFNGAGDIRAFPLLCGLLFAFSLIMGPLAGAFSRHAERGADRFALEALKDKESFISAMKKLSEMNLADPNPHPVIEFLFYDHPAISKRIRMAEQYRSVS